MDFKDLSHRMKQVRDTKQGENERPYDFEESYRLRGKMLGVLIHDARRKAARSLEDCAHLLNLETEVIAAWEYGEQVPSLPQLELLASYLEIPVSHFWGQKTIETDPNERMSAQEQFIQLRQRMIGALLRQAREETQQSLEQVAEAASIPLELLQHYELGEMPIPLHELSVLSNIVNRNMSYFLETESYIGELLRIREEWKHFTDLDDEIRQFAANPLNVAFIKIAITFSKMPAAQLRQAAEGLLEISM